MKRERYVYGATTAIIAALMLVSALNFGFNPDQKDAFRHFGLPPWFAVELTIAKILGAVALVLPAVPAKAREFAYFGFGLTILSADVAHLSSGDPVFYVVPHLVLMGVLVTSYRGFQRRVRAAA